MCNMEYIKLLLSKFDGKDVSEQVLEYKNHEIPYWYTNIDQKDAVFKLSSSRVPGKYSIVSTKSSMKGLRFGQYRPDTVECVWVGSQFDIQDENIRDILYGDLQNVLAAKVYIDVVELTSKHIFVKQMYAGLKVGADNDKMD